MTPVAARALAQGLVAAVHGKHPGDWRAGLAQLAQLNGREWLLLDQAARRHNWTDGTPASGVRGWLGPELDDPTGFIAIVTSFHVDGRYRERACRALASKPATTAAPALAVRLLDHVSEVRTTAWDALRPRLGLSTAAPVLDVVLAGRHRQHGPSAHHDTTRQLSSIVPDSTLVAALMGADRRAVRRWAFQVAHDLGLLPADSLIAAASDDRDQWVQAICAKRLMDQPAGSRLVPLLEARSVEARLVALTRVSDDDLNDEKLGRLLLDRAPRVREQARWRARRRSFDLPGFYRDQLIPDSAPREITACLHGLALVGETGDRGDLGALTHALRHDSARVRATAVTLTAARVEPDDAVQLLVPRLLDTSARVATASARALATISAEPDLAEDAWASKTPAHRRAAWILARSTSTGMDTEAASAMATLIVASDLAGHESHGMRRLSEYVDRVRSGAVDPMASPAIDLDTGSLMRVDGRGGFGHVTFAFVTDLAIERAKQFGIRAVAVSRTDHAGRFADFAAHAARAGVITLFFANDAGSGQDVAPWGGDAPRLATNPLAAGIPRACQPGLILDMATSVVAAGRLAEWRDRDETIPSDWVTPSGALRPAGGPRDPGWPSSSRP